MSIEPNDPRLTAYALGELEAEDLASFEALLAEDEAARSELSAIRQTTALLTNELQSDDVQLSREGRARSSTRRCWARNHSRPSIPCEVRS